MSVGSAGSLQAPELESELEAQPEPEPEPEAGALLDGDLLAGFAFLPPVVQAQLAEAAGAAGPGGGGVPWLLSLLAQESL